MQLPFSQVRKITDKSTKTTNNNPHMKKALVILDNTSIILLSYKLQICVSNRKYCSM